MKKIFLTLPLLLVILIFSGCSDDITEEPIQSLKFTTVDNSKRSGIAEQRFVMLLHGMPYGLNMQEMIR